MENFGGLKFKEVAEDALPYAAALFGMKLSSIEILIFQGGAEHRIAIAGGSYGVGTERCIIGVDIVDVCTAVNSFEKFRFDIVDAVPAHMRDFQTILLGRR